VIVRVFNGPEVDIIVELDGRGEQRGEHCEQRHQGRRDPQRRIEEQQRKSVSSAVNGQGR
jgi:hypothetical protein